MLRQIKGILRGSKVAKYSVNICAQIANNLDSKKYPMSLGDLSILISECYSFVLTLANLNQKMSTVERGRMLLSAQNYIKEWLRPIFSQNSPNNSKDEVNAAIDLTISSFTGYWEDWSRELINFKEENTSIPKKQKFDDLVKTIAYYFRERIILYFKENRDIDRQNFASEIDKIVVEPIRKMI